MKRRQQRNKRFAYKQLLTHSHIRGQIYAEREIKSTYVDTEKERKYLQLFNEHTMTYWSFICLSDLHIETCRSLGADHCSILCVCRQSWGRENLYSMDCLQ